jgi:hypothetical protein
MLAVGFSRRAAPIAKTRGTDPVIKPVPRNMAAGNFAAAKNASDRDQNRSSTSEVAIDQSVGERLTEGEWRYGDQRGTETGCREARSLLHIVCHPTDLTHATRLRSTGEAAVYACDRRNRMIRDDWLVIPTRPSSASAHNISRTAVVGSSKYCARSVAE